MCGPAAIAATALGGARFGLSIYQSQQRAEAIESAAEYNARVQHNQAVRIKRKGLEEERAFRQELSQKVSRQRVQAAAGGVRVNTGGVLALQESTETLGMADALRIRKNYQNRFEAMNRRADYTLLSGQNRAQQVALNGVISGIQQGISTGMSIYSFGQGLGLGSAGGSSMGGSVYLERPLSRVNSGYGSLMP